MFKPLHEFTDIAEQSIKTTESHIETQMFHSLMRSKKFILMSEGDKTEGCGLFIFPQAEIKPYRLDFLIKGVGFRKAQRVWPPNSTAYLCLECDGKEYHSSKEDKEKDLVRDEFLKKKGIKTLRYTGTEIYKYSDKVAYDIANFLESMVYDG
jgi:hypothetical protein